MRSNKKIILLVLMSILSIFVFIGCGDSETTEDKLFSQLGLDNQKGYLWSMAEDAVKANLKSPSTAKFPTYGHAQFYDLGNNDFKMKGYVDVQNGFGATIRSYFEVKVNVKDDFDASVDGYRYDVVDVQIE